MSPADKWMARMARAAGTTNSAVAVIGAVGEPHLMPHETTAARTLPSVVSYDATGVRCVGRPAAARVAEDPLNTFHSVKRFIGQQLRDVRDPLQPETCGGSTEVWGW